MSGRLDSIANSLLLFASYRHPERTSEGSIWNDRSVDGFFKCTFRMTIFDTPGEQNGDARRLWPHARSGMPVTPDSAAQWAQQKHWSFASTPWPTIRQPQWAQRGAKAWMAHSKLSNWWVW